MRLSQSSTSTRTFVAVPALVPWFDDRAAHHEQRLAARFGGECTTYRDRVPRWIPWSTLGR